MYDSALVPPQLTILIMCNFTYTDHEQIDSIPRGAVVFVSCPPKTPNAVYGGLMSTRAIASGAVGSVIDGRFRDVQEQRDLNYPV